jgi:hypothetical protein
LSVFDYFGTEKYVFQAILDEFTGPHSNKYILGYASGTYVYATEAEALEACVARVDCGGVTQETATRYTLRNGVELGDFGGETSWLKKSFTGPHSNKFIPGYASGTYVYATINAALEACMARVDCGGVTKELQFTLRSGVILGDFLGETSWLKVGLLGSSSSLCGELLQQFHRVDEELSIQGKWQGGSVTGVCRGWGTSKVRSIVHRFGQMSDGSLNEMCSHVVSFLCI